MKLAVSGKGGVGKSTLAAALSLLIGRTGSRVLAVDADPAASLAGSLGIPVDKRLSIIPISRQMALVHERTGAKVRQYGQVFKLNPEVSDIADKFALTHENVSLLVLGAVDRAGGGCACPESVLIRALVSDLILHKGEAVIMDMEAGLEHLGRATAQGVDTMLVVVEPGRQSLEVGLRIREMAHEIGIKSIRFVANKVAGSGDEQFIREILGGEVLLGSIPLSEELRTADRTGVSVLDAAPEAVRTEFASILQRLAGSV